MDGFDIAGTLTTFASDITAQVGEATPIIAGVVVAVAGMSLGIKFLKKFIAKIG